MRLTSLDGTAEYLAGLAGVRHCRVTVVHAETDLGIPEACREALGTAAGEYIVLLNNDTIVTEPCLDMLTGLAKSFPEIGLVGPMSNYAVAPQLVEVVPYRIGVRGQWSAEAGARAMAGRLLLTPVPWPLTSPP